MTANPTALLEEVFRHIAATSMADVPILNPALNVAAVGFRPWQDAWLGVLITPWFMNLMVLPAEGDLATPVGIRRRLTLPAGEYEFLGSHQERIGPYLAASLFSPMHEFAGPDDARAMAEAVLAAVCVPPALPPEQPDLSRRAFFNRLMPQDKA